MRLEARTSLVTSALPPLQANNGEFSGSSKSMSCLRPLRIGPTGSLSLVWNTAAKRVSISTFSSYTTSAWFNPHCGRALG